MNFSEKYYSRYFEIKQSDWSFQVTRLVLTNQRALFQSKTVTLGYAKMCLRH